MFRSNTGPTPAAVPLGLGSPPAPHCPPARAAAQGSKGQQAVCEHQLTEIVYSLFPVRRIGIGRPPPPAPGSGPPSRPSAWPAAPEPERATAPVAQSQRQACPGCWSRPQEPARRALAAGPCHLAARERLHAAAAAKPLPHALAERAVRFEQPRRPWPQSPELIGSATRVARPPAGGLPQASGQPAPAPGSGSPSAEDERQGR